MNSVPETNVYARDLVWRLFREAADEDYTVARWAARHGLMYQFYWSSQQALEKCMKCILLLNGTNISGFSHGLLPLFDQTTKIAGELLPLLFIPPKYFPGGQLFTGGITEPLEILVKRIDEKGNPSNRYRHYSNTIHGYDLHKVDELFFQLRRLTYPLDMKYGNTSKTFREVLSKSPSYHPHEPFQKFSGVSKDEKEGLADTLRWRNFSFFEDAAIEAGRICSGMGVINSPISLAFEGDAQRIDAMEWLLGNARFSRAERNEIQALLAEVKCRSQVVGT